MIHLLDPVFEDPALAQIAEEAHRLMGGKCGVHVQGEAESVLVIELPGDSIVRGRWLDKHLRAFCSREGLERRYVVASGTQPRFAAKSPRVPDGWPSDPEAG